MSLCRVTSLLAVTRGGSTNLDGIKSQARLGQWPGNIGPPFKPQITSCANRGGPVARANLDQSRDELERIARLVKALLGRLIELDPEQANSLASLAGLLSSLVEIAESVEE